jgi:hypothetical protein
MPIMRKIKPAINMDKGFLKNSVIPNTINEVPITKK